MVTMLPAKPNVKEERNMHRIMCAECRKKQSIWSWLRSIDPPNGWHEFLRSQWKFYRPKYKNSLPKKQPVYLCPECYASALESERERERKAREQQRKAREEEEAWLASPEVQELLDADDVSKQVFQWLRSREGMKVQIEYKTSAGERFSKSATWVIDSPGRSGDHVVWQIPMGKIGFDLGSPGEYYHKVEVGEDEMAYSMGYRYILDSKGDAIAANWARTDERLDFVETYEFRPHKS
jgi:hypothetical protein